MCNKDVLEGEVNKKHISFCQVNIKGYTCQGHDEIKDFFQKALLFFKVFLFLCPSYSAVQMAHTVLLQQDLALPVLLVKCVSMAAATCHQQTAALGHTALLARPHALSANQVSCTSSWVC